MEDVIGTACTGIIRNFQEDQCAGLDGGDEGIVGTQEAPGDGEGFRRVSPGLGRLLRDRTEGAGLESLWVDDDDRPHLLDDERVMEGEEERTRTLKEESCSSSFMVMKMIELRERCGICDSVNLRTCRLEQQGYARGARRMWGQ